MQAKQDTFLESKEFKYYLTYLELINKLREENPLQILKKIQPLIEMINAKKYLIKKEAGKTKVYLNIDMRFQNLLEMNTFRSDLMEKLRDLRTKGIVYQVQNENEDLQQAKLSMTLIIEEQ